MGVYFEHKLLFLSHIADGFIVVPSLSRKSCRPNLRRTVGKPAHNGAC